MKQTPLERVNQESHAKEHMKQENKGLLSFANPPIVDGEYNMTDDQLRKKIIERLPPNKFEALKSSILAAVEDSSMIADISLNKELYILTIKIRPDSTNTRSNLSDEEKDTIRMRVPITTAIEYVINEDQS